MTACSSGDIPLSYIALREATREGEGEVEVDGG
jgi:hypothetical protein